MTSGIASGLSSGIASGILTDMDTTITFALRTDDTAWITRNHGTIGEAGRVFVQVPADQAETFTRMGRQWLRHVFADVPADALNAAISCPLAWVPEVAR